MACPPPRETLVHGAELAARGTPRLVGTRVIRTSHDCHRTPLDAVTFAPQSAAIGAGQTIPHTSFWDCSRSIARPHSLRFRSREPQPSKRKQPKEAPDSGHGREVAKEQEEWSRRFAGGKPTSCSVAERST